MDGGRLARKLCAILIGIIFIQFADAQDTASVYWYFDGHPDNWVIRKDINTAELERKSSGRKLLPVAKKAERGSPVSNRILYIDDQVLVAFRKTISPAELEEFSTRYGLVPVNGAGENQKDVYVFKYTRFTDSDNSATVSAKIFEQEGSKILLAQPNRVNLFEPQSGGDDVDLAWHIANGGQQISCSGIQGEHHADAHITGAWDQGITGSGIKVGVIDFYGFDYNHPDMQGQMLPGWDCINNAPYDASNFFFTDPTQAHGMAVCGVIAAKANNNIGSEGVAYDSKVVPFLIDGSESSVILAMQKAMSSDFDVDVVNCSFGSYFPSPAIQTEIQNMVNSGRVRYGNTKGIVVVASQGNDNYSDVDHPQYPAVYEEVISVSASTPDDRKKTPGDAWETSSSWGTNYGALLDIAAPGVCIYTTDISGTNGYSTADYVAFQKTSASAPIVAGVAALVLSKNPSLTWQEVKTRLEESADKTNNSSEGGGYNYNFDPDASGHSMEMGYGRVNAEKAVSDTQVGISNTTTEETKSGFIINPFVTENLDIHYTLDAKYPSYEIRILDITGKSLLQISLPSGSGYLNFNIAQLRSGMYLLECANGKSLVSKEKFIKVR